MNLLRRHPIAVLFACLVVVTAFFPLPAVVDAVTGAVPGNAHLVRPPLYLLLAPLSDVLDAMTFLSLERAQALLAEWAAVAALAGLLSWGTVRRRLFRAVAGVFAVLGLALLALLLPRPAVRLVSDDPALTVIDFHAHTAASHDGRHGWTAADLARWHARQGFGAAYVTDHNVLFPGADSTAIPLLAGVEWSVYRQHIVALGATQPIARDSFSQDTPHMLKVFAALHAQGAIAIASIPEYWENHREDLDDFVRAGVDGFEIVNCSPKGLRFDSAARADVVDLARRHNLLVTGASDNHGWGKATCVWNLSSPSAHGFGGNEVVARTIALAQGDRPAWPAGAGQLWLMFRTLSWSERVLWLMWLVVYLAWFAVPRRRGQKAGLGLLARSLR